MLILLLLFIAMTDACVQIDVSCSTSINFGSNGANECLTFSSTLPNNHLCVRLENKVQTLDITSTADHTVYEIMIHKDISDSFPIVRVDDDAFTSLTNLTSLRFENVHFQSPNLNLKVSNTLLYLKLENTGLADLSLVEPSPYRLKTIDLSGNLFSKIPKLLYEREYVQPLQVQGLVAHPLTEALDAPSTRNLQKNLREYASLLDCLMGANKTSICRQSTPDLQMFNSQMTNLEATETTETVAPRSITRQSSSDNTLTIIVIVIVLVALGLAYFVARRYFWTSTRSQSPAPSSPINTTTVNLIPKHDPEQEDKHNLMARDDILRDYRLEQQDIQLTKQIGIGRLWSGTYKSEKVIIKRIEAENSDSYVTKDLTNQARRLVTLRHENIVKMYGVTWIQGTDFAIVGEYMDKGTLKSVLMDNTLDLDLHTKLDMCRDVAHALAYLHRENMYMECLSSRKVLVNNSIACKLNLFECHAIPKSIEISEIYGSGDMAWWAPELIVRSAPLDARKVNIFALGVLLSEILVRVSPYQNDINRHGQTLSDLALVKRIRRQEPLYPHDNCELYQETPLILREIIARCLAYHPMERPTADEVVNCLDMIKNASVHGSTTSL